ncbi:MAG: type II toxin-antitoxin system HicB family antitoxin [Patescibacteria group bacterium]
MTKELKKRGPAPFFAVELDQEEDGRWIAEIPKIAGAMAYGKTKNEATRKAYAVALRTMADDLEHGNAPTVILRLMEHAMARR